MVDQMYGWLFGTRQPPATSKTQLPLCSTPSARGSWRSVMSLASFVASEPPCCSWDIEVMPYSLAVTRDEKRTCDRLMGRYARAAALNGSVIHAIPPQLAFVGGNSCCNTQARGDKAALQWVPASCRLVPWSAGTFCSTLRRRKLLFIGDSTSHQLASVVMNRIAWAASSDPAASCSLQVLYGISDTLLAERMGRSTARGLHYLEWIRKVRPAIVVLQASHHVYKSHNYLRVLKHVALNAAELPNVTFIWQGSVPGGCGPVPLERLPKEGTAIIEELEALRRAGGNASMVAQTASVTAPTGATSAPGLSYNWKEMRQRDAFARHYFSNATARSYSAAGRDAAAGRVHFLGLEPLHYRVDMHVGSGQPDAPHADCLHFCIPGPLALFPQLLLHFLRGL